MITSLSNDHVKRVRALQSRRRARHKAGRFVIEGNNLAREAIATETPVEEVFYTEAFASDGEGASLLEDLSMLGATLFPVDEAVMQAMSDTRTPQGILAVLPVLRLQPPADFTFALVIDRIADPGNMGTIMRAAAAAGVPVMLVTTGTVDLTNPKVVRSAVGAHFRLPVRHLSWEGLAGRLSQHAVFLAESGSGAPYYAVDWTQPCALVASDEAHGPSEDALRLAHAHVTIPMPGGMESLNVAMATGILLFEMVRQRTQPPG
jgi:TrmH family RNA methyltransferase